MTPPADGLHQEGPADPDGTAAGTRGPYRVGTLTYTKAGLFAVFGWMLWGDFCLVLMESAAPAVLQVNLKEWGAANWIISLVLVVIPGFFNTTVCPASSYWSDRFRSRWGRRIPFLFVATIPLTLFLVLIGFSRQIGTWLHGALQGGLGVSQTSVVLAVVVVFVIGFQLFNMVICSVYYYLFNDVVPVRFLGRFLALFRVVGTLAGVTFNWFMFQYAVSHMTEVYLIAATLYCSAFLLMCWRVKEGEYPPPPPAVDGGSGLVSGIRTFFQESYSARFYWYFYLANTFWAMTGAAALSFGILQAQSIGLDLEFIGKVAAVGGVLTAVFLYPAGMVADRIHPLKVLIVASIANTCIAPLGLVFFFYDFSLPVTQAVFIAITCVGTTASAVYQASELPTYMRLLPKERYGQFCSANALVRSVGVMAAGVTVGFLLDAIAPFFPRKNFEYRLIPLWPLLMGSVSVFFLLRLHREWKKLGGNHSFEPPPVGPACGMPSLPGSCRPGR